MFLTLNTPHSVYYCLAFNEWPFQAWNDFSDNW